MPVPLQVTIRDLPDSPAIEARIQKEADKLGHLYDRIISCHVIVEIPQKHKHKGKLFTARIDLAIPNKEIVVNRVLEEDVYVAIREAFHAARRQLETHLQRQRGNLKHHSETHVGKIIRLFPEENYGFIETPEGSQYYFQASNILSLKFEELKIGLRVKFLEVVAGDGLQATHIIADDGK